MEIKQVAKIGCGQDGAIYGSELFRFEITGRCRVYRFEEITGDGSAIEPFAEFVLDRSETIVPHSNAVCFGCERYEANDPYPLLYSNIYNNYAKTENKRIGMCLVYRILREGDVFYSSLVQTIEIGFCEDPELWKAHPDRHGVRPYGNFLVDPDTRSYWAFVMRAEEQGSRYFRFDLPAARDGEMDAELGARRVVLTPADIREQFDGSYHRYMQGGTIHGGKLYSTEGFRGDEVNRPAIRVIDLASHSEKYFDITELGFWDEPECISFHEDACLYSDFSGHVFRVEF